MPRILEIIHTCGGCPKYGYYSGNQHECKLLGQIVHDKAIIAPFCPLPVYPDQTIADQDTTIRLLREPNKYSLQYAILSYVVSRLQTTANERAVNIPLADGTIIYLAFDAITEIEFPYGIIHFMYGEEKYKLSPGGQEPQLSLQVTHPGIEEPLWRVLDLA